jgi:hypothetical protein
MHAKCMVDELQPENATLSKVLDPILSGFKYTYNLYKQTLSFIVSIIEMPHFNLYLF